MAEHSDSDPSDSDPSDSAAAAKTTAAPSVPADSPADRHAPADSIGTRRRRVVHILRQVMVIVLVAVLVGVYVYFSRVDHAPAPREVAEPPGPIGVGVVVVEPQALPLRSQYLAQTEASQTVPIRARVAGYLLQRSFEEGQPVEQGQLLYRIDPRPFEVALAQAESQLRAAEARLQRAEQQLERTEELVSRRAASASELEQLQEEQQVAAADVQLQEARIAQSQLDLDYATIHSPITGVIGENLQDVGSYISPAGDSVLATVRQVDPLYVRFSVSERDLLRWQRWISEGVVSDVPTEQFEVEVELPDGRVHPHRGRIDFVDVAIDPSTGTAVVRATVPNPENQLRPGQFVTAHVTGANRIGAFAVPQAAVMQNPSGTSVYVVDDQGVARSRPIEPGELYDDLWIVESGLRAGDRVIVDHLMQVRAGTPVDATIVAADSVSTSSESDAPPEGAGAPTGSGLSAGPGQAETAPGG